MSNWTREEDDLLLALIDEHDAQWWVIAQHVPGRSRHACRKRFERLTKKRKKASQGDSSHPVISHRVLYDPEKSAGWRERIQLASIVKGVRDRDTPFIPIADVSITSDRPIGILFSSDWQLGSLGVDYPTWQDHITQFLDMDRLYMVVNGDLISNTHSHKVLSAVWGQVMSPEEQALLVGGIAKEMVDKDKLLAITLSEEHDQKDARDIGRSSILDMLRDKKVPLFDNRGTLVVRLGKMIYIIYCVHRSRFYSSFNQLHSGYREFSLGVPANIVVVSHKHQAAMGWFPWYPELRMLTEHLELPIRLGREVIVVQTATYETESKFGGQFFGRGNRPELQIAILYPNEFRMDIARSFEDAEKLMSG